jgi:hypothetical protein
MDEADKFIKTFLFLDNNRSESLIEYHSIFIVHSIVMFRINGIYSLHEFGNGIIAGFDYKVVAVAHDGPSKALKREFIKSSSEFFKEKGPQLVVWEESLTRSTTGGDDVEGIWDDNSGFRAHGLDPLLRGGKEG